MTAQSKTIRHDGIATGYLDAAPVSGRAEATILLVHDGWFGADATSLWARVIPALAERFRVLAPDMVGFGRTDKVVWFDRSMYAYRAAHLGSFVRAALGEDTPVHGVGTSMGGSILLRDAVADPPAIPLASAVSISGSGGPWRSQFGAAELSRYEGAEEDQRRMLPHLADSFPEADDFVADRHANAQQPGHALALLAGTVKAPVPAPTKPADSWPAPLSGVKIPVTVVGCADDPLMESGWEDHFENVSPRVSVARLQARHAPSLDHPEEVVSIIESHLARAGQEVSA